MEVGLWFLTFFSFRSSVTKFNSGCMKISTLECDLTSNNISVYGYYIGKVQAQLGDQRSPWVESKQIILDRDSEFKFRFMSCFVSVNLQSKIYVSWLRHLGDSQEPLVNSQKGRCSG